MSLNKALLIGNVGKEPEIRYLDGNQNTNGGTKVATITLATSERYRDRAGNMQENTEWHTVVAWRNQADIAEKYIHKGTQIYVEGRIRTRSWTDQTGNKRYTTEIQADTIQLLGRRPDGQDQQGWQPAQQPAYQPQAQRPAPQQTWQPQAPAAAPAVAPEPADNPADDLPF